MRIHLNYAALQRKLDGPGADRARKDLANAIADNVRRQGIMVGSIDAGDSTETELPVIVSDAGNVIVAHPAGIAVEAKYGALVKAAAAVGLEVNS